MNLFLLMYFSCHAPLSQKEPNPPSLEDSWTLASTSDQIELIDTVSDEGHRVIVRTINEYGLTVAPETLNRIQVSVNDEVHSIDIDADGFGEITIPATQPSAANVEYESSTSVAYFKPKSKTMLSHSLELPDPDQQVTNILNLNDSLIVQKEEHLYFQSNDVSDKAYYLGAVPFSSIVEYSWGSEIHFNKVQGDVNLDGLEDLVMWNEKNIYVFKGHPLGLRFVGTFNFYEKNIVQVDTITHSSNSRTDLFIGLNDTEEPLYSYGYRVSFDNDFIPSEQSYPTFTQQSNNLYALSNSETFAVGMHNDTRHFWFSEQKDQWFSFGDMPSFGGLYEHIFIETFDFGDDGNEDLLIWALKDNSFDLLLYTVHLSFETHRVAHGVILYEQNYDSPFMYRTSFKDDKISYILLFDDTDLRMIVNNEGSLNGMSTSFPYDPGPILPVRKDDSILFYYGEKDNLLRMDVEIENNSMITRPSYKPQFHEFLESYIGILKLPNSDEFVGYRNGETETETIVDILSADGQLTEHSFDLVGHFENIAACDNHIYMTTSAENSLYVITREEDNATKQSFPLYGSQIKCKDAYVLLYGENGWALYDEEYNVVQSGDDSWSDADIGYPTQADDVEIVGCSDVGCQIDLVDLDGDGIDELFEQSEISTLTSHWGTDTFEFTGEAYSIDNNNDGTLELLIVDGAKIYEIDTYATGVFPLVIHDMHTFDEYYTIVATDMDGLSDRNFYLYSEHSLGY
ncbi:MAG: hypothetical protein CMK59_07210 [Proteobacteria bacterium]|nr:hypothetical protein [Pseudomonadota bacterium]